MLHSRDKSPNYCSEMAALSSTKRLQVLVPFLNFLFPSSSCRTKFLSTLSKFMSKGGEFCSSPNYLSNVI